MTNTKPKPGETGGAPFSTPGKNTSGPVANQTIVALQGELKQLTNDLEAIAAGMAGSTFAEGDRKRLEARIAALKSILANFDSGARKT
jgi:hypothetical protein